LTSDSYNSAVFYIGANNEYDMYAIDAKNTSRFELDPVYDRFEGSRWIRMYDNSLVSYGALVLAVDEYRSEIQNKSLTGRPDWSTAPPGAAEDWAQGAVSWNLTAQLKYPLGTPEFIRNITATKSSSREWIRMDLMFRQSETEMEDNNPPKFAHISHFYAQRLNTASRIQLSFTFLIIVIVCNSVKLLTMLWVVLMERQDYLVTLGDGAATFLEHPDSTTERMSILSKPEIVHEVTDAKLNFKHDDHLQRLVTQSGKRWTKQHTTYSNALNRDREIGSYFM
jgi:hypothetical protein